MLFNIINFFEFLIYLLPALLCMVMYTLVERQLMASIQRRLGPSYISNNGLLQPLADGLKAILKESLIPRKANIFLFIFAPCLSFGLSIFGWLIFPTNYNAPWIINLPLTLLFFLAISSLSIYAIILSGWSSNSRYAFLGSIRSAAQMISYEVCLALTLLPMIMLSGSVNFIDIVKYQETHIWFIIPFWPLAIILFIISLAETNRAPFDLPEAEAEIVAGYNIEYSGMLFALFFLGEYSNMMCISYLNVIFFWGGWLPFFDINLPFISEISLAIKTCAYCLLFVIIRAIVPRLRYDQLMDLGWKKLLPIVLAYFMFTITFLIFFIL